MKRYMLSGLAAAGLLLGGLAVSGGSASAEEVKPGQEVCGPLDSGKIDTTGSPATITVPNAAAPLPEGYLIDGYCVKAGSDQSVEDGAVVYVDLDPPVDTITFKGPGGKAISHYSVSYVKITNETTTTTTTTIKAEPEEPVTTPASAPPSTEAAVSAAGPVPPPAAAPAPAAGTVAAAPTALPSTGSSSWGLAFAALASLLGGLGLVKLSRRPA
jgi:LPXTG-motif cell wall-anchored protein